MATASRSGNLGLIRQLFNEGTSTGLSDARLLERFVTWGDESAFAALVSRHAALVLNTCQAVLKDPDAAADAFQATFVLLFRKARSIRGRDALGAWLHRVAYRTALQARSAAARRRDVEQAAGAGRSPEDREPDDLGPVLHEELDRLPERFRLPMVLCYLEGMTRDQAADYLRCTEGSVRGRLAKGRELLRDRLARRGVTLAVPCLSRAAVPESLVATTVRIAAGGASGSVAAIVASASRGRLLTRFKVVAVLTLTLGAMSAALLKRDGLPQPRDREAVRSFTDQPPDPATGHRFKRHTPGTRWVAAHRQPEDDAATGRRTQRRGRRCPVEGRILDLEGRPVAGATVSIQHVQSPPGGKLDAWIDEVKRLGKQPFGLPIMASPGQGPARPRPRPDASWHSHFSSAP